MLFNKIGETYNKTRAADVRIISELIRLLGLQEGATIADIGAGTGNYSFALAKASYKIKAIGHFIPGYIRLIIHQASTRQANAIKENFFSNFQKAKCHRRQRGLQAAGEFLLL